MSTSTEERVDRAPADWTPSFSKWRHGGWYVNNVRYPSGAVGCISKNYPDGKWRIVCHPLPFDQQPTFKSRDEAARAEWLHARSPEMLADWEAEESRRAARQAEREAAEQRIKDREQAEQRRLVELVARDIREAAQCGTANSEAIAAWVLKNFVERAVHDDVVAEHRETLQEIAGERENEHAEIIEELNSAIDIAKRADTAIQAVARSVSALETPGALEFAYGSTEAEKVLDVLSSGLHALAEYQDNHSNGDLPEKREIK